MLRNIYNSEYGNMLRPRIPEIWEVLMCESVGVRVLCNILVI